MFVYSELLWLCFMVIVILNFIYSLFWSLLNGFLSLIFNENFYILILKVKLLPQEQKG